MKDDPYFAKKLTFSLPTKDGPVLRTVRDVDAYLERIPVMFERSRHGERSSCILAG